MAPQFWLMKSEPDTFSIDDLARVRVEPWTGVRSYFARAHMRAMSVGDQVLFHHSNAKPPGVAGLARVVKTHVVDATQFDPESPYYDPKATRDQPIWDCVEVEYVETLPHYVTMDRLRAEPAVADMLVLRRGMRLSVQPVSESHYHAVVALGRTAPAADDRSAASAAPPSTARAPRPKQSATRAPRATTAAAAGKPARDGKKAAPTKKPARAGRPAQTARPARSTKRRAGRP